MATILHGGRGRAPSFLMNISSYHYGGPASYSTVRNGRADEISCAPGEFLYCLSSGSPHGFAKWARGPIEEVIDFLKTQGKNPEFMCVTLYLDVPGASRSPQEVEVHQTGVVAYQDAMKARPDIPWGTISISRLLHALHALSEQ